MTAYVTRIASNVKKGVCAELEEKTLIVGPNGAGKSSVVNSIELALGGYSSDVMGRDSLKKPSDLMVLSSDGKTLEVEADLSDGSKATFYTEKTATGAKRPKRTGPESVLFPFTDVTSNLVGSAAKARTWFLQKMAVNLTLDGVAACLPASLREDYKKRAEQCKIVNPSFSQVDILVYLEEAEARKGRESRSEVKVLTSLLDEMQGNMPPWPPTEEQLAKYVQYEREAMEAYAQETGKGTGCSQEQIRDAWDRASTAVAELSQAEKTLTSCREESTRLQSTSGLGESEMQYAQIRRKILPVLDLHADLNASDCLVCGGSVSSPSFFAERAEAFRAANSRFDSVQSAKSRTEEMEARVGGMQEKANLCIQEWKHMESIASTHDPEKARSLLAAYEEATARRIEAENSLKKWDELSAIRDRIEENEEKEKKSKNLAKECRNAVKILLQSAIRTFEGCVQSFLPRTDTFGLHVDMKADTCRFGLRRGGILVSALSGAEWARVITAIGCATTPEKRMAVFIPEERAFDPSTLGEVMKALGNAPGQVILTSTVLPATPPDNWKIIDLSHN